MAPEAEELRPARMPRGTIDRHAARLNANNLVGIVGLNKQECVTQGRNRGLRAFGGCGSSSCSTYSWCCGGGRGHPVNVYVY